MRNCEIQKIWQTNDTITTEIHKCSSYYFSITLPLGKAIIFLIPTLIAYIIFSRGGHSMARRYKQARKMSGLTAVTAAKEMGISNPTINAWESGRKTPSIEGLEKMAELYQVTTDYLLGRPEPFGFDPSTELSQDLIKIFDGRPAWSDRLGWVLVNGPDCMVITNDGTKVTLDVAAPLRAAPLHFATPGLPETNPIPLSELSKHEQVWVEPISPDSQLRNELRGWYQTKGIYVENTSGNRFLYDNYGAKWLAFETTAQLGTKKAPLSEHP